jgi:predicted RNase H-like nuclease (RuvC/YqgF family)
MDKDDVKVEQIDDESEIIEGEVSSDESKEDFSKAAAFLNLEELIKNHIEAIDKLKDELKQKREMFEDTFNNNPTYREHLEKVKEANKAKGSVRQELTKQPSVSQLKQKVDDLRFDIGEQSKTLSDLLQDFKEQTGATEIEARNGKIYAIVSVSKLVTRSSKPS